MSQLVDLAFAYKASKRNVISEGIENFLYECVLENKEEMIKAISRLKQYESMFIIETFAFEILSGMFAHKNKKELLQIISSGSIFKIQQRLLEVFTSDVEIQGVMGRGLSNGI